MVVGCIGRWVRRAVLSAAPKCIDRQITSEQRFHPESHCYSSSMSDENDSVKYTAAAAILHLTRHRGTRKTYEELTGTRVHQRAHFLEFRVVISRL
jgi:hypothetical protein